MSQTISNMMGFVRPNIKKCRQYQKPEYPDIKPILISLSVTTSVASVYTLVYVTGENFLPNGNTYINFGSVKHIPVTYYSSNYISFVVPPINNFNTMTYDVVAVNVYNGGYGYAVKYPGQGSANYSNPLTYTITSNSVYNLQPPDYGYGPFIYPYPLPYTKPEAAAEADTFKYASEAYYDEQLAIIYLNNEITALEDVITQAKKASDALLAIQIAQGKITQAINLNVSANLYQVNLTSALEQYKTAIQTANLEINYVQTQDAQVIAVLQSAQDNIASANDSANLAVTYAIASGNTALPLAQETQTAANFLAINTAGTIKDNITQYLENGLLAIIQSELNQYNASSPAINIINSYLDGIKNLINYLTVVETWTNAVIIDASNAIIPLENG